MSIKVHYLHNHLDHFPKNLGDLSEEQGERFHQDIRVMEERYQGRWDATIIVGVCKGTVLILNTPESATKDTF